jgi:hypothetical protein
MMLSAFGQSFSSSQLCLDTDSTAGEKISTAQYSPATMLAAGKFKRYIKRPPKPDDSVAGGGAAASRRASQDRRSSRNGSQDKLFKAAGRRCSGSQDKMAASSRNGSEDKLAASSRHGSQDKLSRRSDAETSRLLRLNSLDMGRTNSDTQRRRKGFGILAQTTDSTG